MNDIAFVAISAIIVLVLMIFQFRSLNRSHPNSELLIGLLNQLREAPSK